MARRYDYSRWDGTQVGFELDADDILSELTDDILYNGDVNSALRRMMQQGFRDQTGQQVRGVRDLLEKLRQRRRDQLERYDLGGPFEDIARELREVVEQERLSLDELQQDAADSEDQRRKEITDQVAAERRMQLDFLPPDLAGKMKALQDYEFTSSEARQRFDELVERLRSQLVQSQFNQMSGAIGDMDPAQLQRMKDMMHELNTLLEMRERGLDTDAAFAQFMQRFGDYFPDDPKDLDELLESIARQMAAAQAMLNSMTPEQRRQLQNLMDQLLEDIDLRWQMDRLSQNLQRAFPQAGWDRRYNFSGHDPLGMADAASLLNELGDMDALENLLRQASNPGALADVDLERARELLGDESASSLERLAQLSKQLEEAGLIETREGRLELTPRGMRRLGQNALSDLFTKLTKDKLGRHSINPNGVGHERSYETKPYEFGDPFNLHIEKTVRNAISRCGTGTPVRLSPDDFEIERTETTTRTSTVLMLDLSLSMPMRDNFLPAKKVAMALHSLISSQYPRDFLGIVGFSEVARELKAAQLPEVSWDFVYGTNMQHGFQIARRLLNRQTGTKQIILITDGEPTAHNTSAGDVFFNYPPARETVDATLAEVNKLTRDGIVINTFMLDATSYLRDFIEKLSRMNGGRAFFTTPENLGDYVLVDFIEHRRSMRTGRGRRAG